MGYEQLSTVIVLIIVLIGVVVWLPIRTSNSMRHVEEHREDRYSTSLHLVDEHSGTRFSDETAFAKGVQMQPSERRANTLTPERISEVRRLRHAAVRRRQMIVAALLVITVVVLVLAVTLHFSTLYALIPAALTAVVLALGAHAASQAREWERKVAEAKARERRSRAARMKARKAQVEQRPGAAPARAAGEDNAPTDEMTGIEIRRALRQAQLEQKKALAERARKIAEAQARLAAAQAQAEAQARAQAAAEAARQAAAAAAQQTAQQSASADAAVAPQAQAPVQNQPQSTGAPVMVAPQQAVSGATGAPVVAQTKPKAEASAPVDAASDHTTELAEVHPARALDAYDMATSQDLISFSLGEARNVEADEPKAPESREIKSMRQVAKAEPVDAQRERELAEEAKIETEPASSHAGKDESSESAAKTAEDVADESVVEAVEEASRAEEESRPVQKAGMSDVEAFHEAEEQAKVAVPAATSDSLGNNLAEILARRGA
ncbi:hypothetical protein JS528_10220 [Bifidobacterium sp. MA2]|uniref:Membrane associated protein n=1 Tax=Bifidobacterium santillanense TaxID=2809028 RepID=A0ABS5URQ6_9BIFI|nr:hypothetical protein [Bifidobacterium santillanense]MBT1173703.1 hypothetical protein [Bifidobacterium santillanense]